MEDVFAYLSSYERVYHRGPCLSMKPRHGPPVYLGFAVEAGGRKNLVAMDKREGRPRSIWNKIWS
jgi:hypothetical protein